MEKIERRVWREARAMTRREVITKAIAKQRAGRKQPESPCCEKNPLTKVNRPEQ